MANCGQHVLTSAEPRQLLSRGCARAAHALVWLCALCAPLTAAVAQQKPPGNDELRSMYCVSVIRAEIGLQQHMIFAADEAASNASSAEARQQWNATSAELRAGLTRLEAVLTRLQAYMLPRIGSLDAFALRTAIRQGDDEFELSRTMADRCAVACSTQRVPDNETQACSAGCNDNTLLSRVSGCDNPTWLPP
jgi:hypothetical protein